MIDSFDADLLWLILIHGQVRQDRNVHDYLADLDSEVPLYMKVQDQLLIISHSPLITILQAGQLINFLSSWTPPIGLLTPQETVQLTYQCSFDPFMKFSNILYTS